MQEVLFVHALTPLHPGSGSTIDVIDLPVAREKVTGYPYLPGSSLKGVLRAGLEETTDTELWRAAFGHEKNASEHAGSLVFTDARLVLFPVRSERGVFAWATCPFALLRLQRELPRADFPKVPEFVAEDQVLVPRESLVQSGPRVRFEDLDLVAVRDEGGTGATALAAWFAKHLFTESERKAFSGRFVVVSDDAFAFLTQTATEVNARIRIDSTTRVVDKGGLWYEEALPAESVLAALVVAHPPRRKEVRPGKDARDMMAVLDGIDRRLWTFGGKETVGRGRARLVRLGQGGE